VLLAIFKPNVKVLSLFALLAFICVGGVIQTYAFIDDVSEVPKPPLYDVLKPIDLWFPWMLFSTPIHMLGNVFNLWWMLEYFPEFVAGFKLPPASIVYAYIVSCCTVYCWKKWFKHSRHKGRLIVLSIIIAAIINPPFAFINMPLTLNLLTFTISGFTLTAIVILVYTILFHGLCKGTSLLIETRGTIGKT